MRSPKDRNEFLSLIAAGGVIAEIGVFEGEYSAKILERTRPRRLHLIDTWEFVSGTLDGLYVSQAQMDSKYRSVQSAFANNSAVEIIRASSPAVADRFADELFDLVYIDSCHEYEPVSADLNAWWPKVKSGGYLAGHDFLTNEWVAVEKAVNDFCRTRGLSLAVLTRCRYPTWGIIKP